MRLGFDARGAAVSEDPKPERKDFSGLGSGDLAPVRKPAPSFMEFSISSRVDLAHNKRVKSDVQQHSKDY